MGFLYRTNYHGWADSIWVSNGKVEAIIVPQVGRVMQFRMAGEIDGPFWENPALAGKPADAKASEWLNFGGDKVWPAPQKDWGEMTPTNYPPPVGFDQVPCEVKIDGWVVTLKTPIDPYYGIQVTRVITLPVGRPAMEIITTFEKVQGRTLDVSIWTVTQLKEPLVSYTRVPVPGRFPQGFELLSQDRPPSVNLDQGLLSLQRNPKSPHKIGLESGVLLWVGPRYMLRIDSPRHLFDTYPENGSSAAIYTSADPVPYVDYEMLGQISQMRRGYRMNRMSIYTLLPRTELDVVMDVRKQLLQ